MTIHFPVWLCWILAVGGYLVGMVITSGVAGIMDDGPTGNERLDQVLIAVAVLLWPLTWVGLAVALTGLFLLRLMFP